MIVDVYELDRQMSFLREEIGRLRENHPSASWAQIKAERLGQILETLRQLRQAKQMAGVAEVQVG